MKHGVVRAVVAFAVVLSALAMGTPARADDEPSDPLRVMLVGDSITHSNSGMYSWRYRLWQEFRRQQVPVDFVGPFRHVYDGAGEVSGHYLDPAFDRDHAAWNGAFVNRPESDHATRISQQARIAGWLRVYEPDVLVVHLGRNDLKAGDSADKVAAETKRYVETVHEVAPATRIILNDVLKRLGMTGDRTGVRLNALNRAQFADDPLVTFARTQSGAGLAFDPARHTVDGTHPNATGETLIAHRVAQAFHRIGVLPEQPMVYRVVRWNPRARINVRALGHQIRVAWDPTRFRYNAQLVLRMPNGATKVWGTFNGRRRHTSTTPGLRNGTYQVWLVPFKGRLSRGVRTPVVKVRLGG